MRVQGVEAGLVREDAVSPGGEGLGERWDLRRHFVAFTFHKKKNYTFKTIILIQLVLFETYICIACFRNGHNIYQY